MPWAVGDKVLLTERGGSMLLGSESDQIAGAVLSLVSFSVLFNS
jgi:hypothetical protein